MADFQEQNTETDNELMENGDIPAVNLFFKYYNFNHGGEDFPIHHWQEGTEIDDHAHPRARELHEMIGQELNTYTPINAFLTQIGISEDRHDDIEMDIMDRGINENERMDGGYAYYTEDERGTDAHPNYQFFMDELVEQDRIGERLDEDGATEYYADIEENFNHETELLDEIQGFDNFATGYQTTENQMLEFRDDIRNQIAEIMQYRQDVIQQTMRNMIGVRPIEYEGVEEDTDDEREIAEQPNREYIAEQAEDMVSKGSKVRPKGKRRFRNRYKDATAIAIQDAMKEKELSEFKL